MTLFRRREPDGGPTTHALVIGVGTYPWLLGGSAGGDPDVAEGMGQLQSPPRSAVAMADWLMATHDDPTAPLATVELLLSDGDTPVAYAPPGGAAMEVAMPTKDAVAQSIRDWKARGGEHDGNVVLFYFCGHGVGRGFDLALLMRDYGSDDETPFRHSVWFEGLKEGMKHCPATRQVYFVDACRVGSERLLRDHTAMLDPIIGVRTPFSPGLRQSIYYATTTGQPAFGRAGEPSVFTGNLLQGLAGMASNDDRGDWWIETTGLQRVLTVLADEFAPDDVGGLQSPTSGEQVSFDFHRLPGAPRVPLYLDATWREDDEEPPADIGRVRVHGDAGEVVEWLHPWVPTPDCRWESGRFRSDQTAGERYAWSVTHDDGRESRSALRTLNPPFRIVELPRDGVA